MLSVFPVTGSNRVMAEETIEDNIKTITTAVSTAVQPVETETTTTTAVSTAITTASTTLVSEIFIVPLTPVTTIAVSDDQGTYENLTLCSV